MNAIGVQPPVEHFGQQWHQLQADMNQVIERMEWLPHDRAIAIGRVHSSCPDEGGWWVRYDLPMTALRMHTAGWHYLQPCTAETPWVSWPQREFTT